MPERLLLVRRQGLAPPLLAAGRPGAQPEVDVVEDLSRFVDHLSKL